MKCGSSRSRTFWRALQHGHAQAVAAQRVGGLHADVSRSDHHRAPGPLLAEEAAHALGVFEGVQREDVGLLGARDAGGIAARAGRDYEVVVMHAVAGLELHFAARVSDGDHARPGAHLDITLLAEIFGCVDDQLAGLADASFDEIRQPAGPIGNDGAFLQDHDVEAADRCAARAPPRSGPPRRLR